MHHISLMEKGELVTYTLKLHYKRIRSVIFRSVENESKTFMVSLPYGTTLGDVEAIFLKNKPKLMRLHSKQKQIPFDTSTYLFGQYMPLESIVDTYHLKKLPTDIEMFYKEMKKPFLLFLTKRVRFYEQKMAVNVSYKIRIRTMKTRWATNSKKTLTLTFNEKVIHFHPDVIDALIVHELAHHFIGGHGPGFYAYLETIYPHYRRYDSMLKEHQYEGYHEPSKPEN